MEISFQQKYQKFYVYSNLQNFYILCVNRFKDQCRILQIDRTVSDLKCQVLPFPEKLDLKKGLSQIGRHLDESKAGNPQALRQVISACFVCKAYGILGFPVFLDGHYIHLITGRQVIGKIFGSLVYKVTEARLETVFNKEKSCLNVGGKHRVRETRYLQLFNSIDITDFIFSYDVDLTHPLETVLLQMALNNGASFSDAHINKFRRSSLKKLSSKEPDSSPNVLDTRDRFVWNTHILQTLNKSHTAQELILPVLCGYFESQVLEIQNKQLHLGIISRRSRFNPGPRFLRRGLDANGNPANEVETEFFAYEMVPLLSKIKKFSSYLFVD